MSRRELVAFRALLVALVANTVLPLAVADRLTQRALATARRAAL